MNVLLMEQDERVTACLPIRSFDDAEHLLMATPFGPEILELIITE